MSTYEVAKIIAGRIGGTTSTVRAILETIDGIDPELYDDTEIEEELEASFSLEICGICGWWWDRNELTSDGCPDCRDDEWEEAYY